VWVAQLDAPVWICDVDGAVTYINDQASKMFAWENSCESCLPCHLLVAAESLSGKPFCCPRCYIRRCLDESVPVAPKTLLIPDASGEKRRVQIFALAVPGRSPSKPRLVHIAATSAPSLARSYLEKVARRSGSLDYSSIEVDALTEREQEILLRLVEDDSLKAIADALHISHHTVRNHVQHVIDKLGAHSLAEAIARFVMRRD
jgi:DNA-binding CsgD family transcriptional regulator